MRENVVHKIMFGKLMRKELIAVDAIADNNYKNKYTVKNPRLNTRIFLLKEKSNEKNSMDTNKSAFSVDKQLPYGDISTG